jgi:hypothetical protein
VNPERRRAQRSPVQGETFVQMPISLPVQVLDISRGGVLLQSSRPVNVGLRAPLRLKLGGESFETEVMVTRISPSSGGAYTIGAMFLAVTPEDRRLIDRFTRE